MPVVIVRGELIWMGCHGFHMWMWDPYHWMLLIKICIFIYGGHGPEERSQYCLNLNCRAPPGRLLQIWRVGGGMFELIPT